jgi:hypothetical protein
MVIIRSVWKLLPDCHSPASAKSFKLGSDDALESGTKERGKLLVGCQMRFQLAGKLGLYAVGEPFFELILRTLRHLDKPDAGLTR